jgi:hypothetical protein
MVEIEGSASPAGSASPRQKISEALKQSDQTLPRHGDDNRALLGVRNHILVMAVSHLLTELHAEE